MRLTIAFLCVTTVIYGHTHMEQDNQEKSLENLGNTADSEDPTRSSSFLRSYYSKSSRGPMTADDKEKFFYTWYNNGRPSAAKFHTILQTKFPGEFIPTVNTLDGYMPEYKHRALELDAEAHMQIEAAVIAEKVEMLRRHAVTGFKIQNIAIEYIEAHQDQMSMPAAVRLLVEGVRIERESRGIPEALEKMSKMTDEEVLEEIKQIITSSQVTLEEIDANT